MESNDRDGDGKISCEDFLEFYRTKAIEKEEVVWDNLSSFKYGPDLQLLTAVDS
jgi:hypothetical protein